MAEKLKGVVLAGGSGTRLLPLTKITNKHLLPVYDRPMIYYPIQILVNAGVTDIMIVTGGNNPGDFLRLLQDGREFGLKRISYAYQEGSGGIPVALSLAEDFAEDSPLIVILGDQIIEKNIVRATKEFIEQGHGAKIMLSEVSQPESFGVPRFEDDRIVEIKEKPKHPPSNYAVIGIYFYDSRVFDIIRTLEPSKRGELEITDVSNRYLERGELTYNVLDGWWADPGTSMDSLLTAGVRVKETGANRLD